MSGRLRRIRCTNWPMPIAPVSPSPLTPIASIVLLASMRAGRHRRHAPVHGVEAVRLVQEIRRALARAADARELDDALRVDAHLEERVDDALGDRVVPAPGAERRLAAAIGCDSSRPMRLVFLAGGCGRHVRRSISARFLRQDSVGDAAGVDRQAVVVQHAANALRQNAGRRPSAAGSASARRDSARRRRRGRAGG